jgi:signal transduction histidine kinase
VRLTQYELHSSKLEYLGIVVAMTSFCREFSDQQKVEIDFKSDGLPTRLSPEISLCLFRVLQEALHNSVKHSGVRHFDVKLRGDSREIHLDISDSGQGFELEAAIQRRGLGLISMRERVRLVNGTIAIESKPMKGTTINVRVPFKSQEADQRAAG